MRGIGELLGRILDLDFWKYPGYLKSELAASGQWIGVPLRSMLDCQQLARFSDDPSGRIAMRSDPGASVGTAMRLCAP